MNALNLLLRFLLEILALTAVGIWGWEQGTQWTQWLFAIILPIVFAMIWGLFNVPDDPSRSGKAPIQISGLLRLILELALFSFAIMALFHLEYQALSLGYAAIISFHYVASYKRIKWLLKR